jgi:hypothetical protein
MEKVIEVTGPGHAFIDHVKQHRDGKKYVLGPSLMDAPATHPYRQFHTRCDGKGLTLTVAMTSGQYCMISFVFFVRPFRRRKPL